MYRRTGPTGRPGLSRPKGIPTLRSEPQSEVRSQLDNVTHGLLGIALGMLRRREGGPERGSLATVTDRAVPWATFLAAELPDLDVFLGRGPMAGYVFHRGFSHALLMAPVIALIATGLVKLCFRQARTSTLYLWSLGSVLLAHLLADLVTGWGTRLFWPFSHARLALDWVPIVDLLITLPILFMIAAAWIRPRHRHALMVTLFLYLALYVGYRGASHWQVSRAVAQFYTGQPVKQMRVYPDLVDPSAWLFAVDLGDRFEIGETKVREPVLVSGVTPKPEEDPVIRAVRTNPSLQPFFDQFSFVLFSYRPVEGGYEVTLGDIRYQRARSSMAYTVRLNEELQVIGISPGAP